MEELLLKRRREALSFLRASIALLSAKESLDAEPFVKMHESAFNNESPVLPKSVPIYSAESSNQEDGYAAHLAFKHLHKALESLSLISTLEKSPVFVVMYLDISRQINSIVDRHLKHHDNSNVGFTSIKESGRGDRILCQDIVVDAEKRDESHCIGDLEKCVREILNGAISPNKIETSWCDIAGHMQAKNELAESVLLPLHFSELVSFGACVVPSDRTEEFNSNTCTSGSGVRINSSNYSSLSKLSGNNVTKSNVKCKTSVPSSLSDYRPARSILLYGPPGTGKTMLALALAKEANMTLLSLTASDFLSKWLGESEKGVRAAFLALRRIPRPMMFLDEIDAIFSTRGGSTASDSESFRRVKTEFLVRLQSFLNEGSIGIFLGATNLPWELDAAFRRRFELVVHVPLPDAHARIEFLRRRAPHFTEKCLIEASDLLEGYSFSDLRTVWQHASMSPIREWSRAILLNTLQDNDLPSNENEVASRNSTKSHFRNRISDSSTDLKSRLVTVSDIFHSVKTHLPSVDRDLVNQYLEWHSHVP